MEKIIDYFNRHPRSTEVFECDGMLFHTQGAANSIGTEVTKYTRDMLPVETKSEPPVNEDELTPEGEPPVNEDELTPEGAEMEVQPPTKVKTGNKKGN